MMKELKIGVSGFLGAMLLVLADIGLKGDASSIKTMRDHLAQFFGVSNLAMIAIVTTMVLISIGVASCFVFEEATTKKAFFRGASVLAMATAIIPSPQYDPAKTTRHSELVQLDLRTPDRREVVQATLTVWDVDTNRIVAVSPFAGSQFSFYLNAGSYKVNVEIPGYDIQSHNLSVTDGQTPPPVVMRMRRAYFPLFIQRVLK